MTLRRLSAIAIASIVVTTTAAGRTGTTAVAQPASRTETASGVRVTPLSVPQGMLRVYLPDDMAAGDTISGSVVAEPAGRTDAERNANTSVLNGYVVDIGTRTVSVAQRAFTFVVPAGAAATALLLHNAKGKVVARESVPARPAQPPFGRTALPNDFHFPQALAAGHPFTIAGPFSGDFSKSTLAVGGQPVEKIAESPRTMVATAPTNVTGPTNIQLKEGGVAVTAPSRVLALKLTAPKTNLTKGEHTVLHVLVSGLDGLRQPIPLQLVNTTPNVVALAGGQSQRLTIAPSDVRPDHTYAADRDVTSLRPGGFTIYAAIDEHGSAVVDGAPVTPQQSGTTTRPTVPQSQPPVQATATPHALRNPITSDWPQLSDADKKSVQDHLDAGAAARTAAGVNKANEEALAALVVAMKKYCCNFDTMKGGAPVYDPTTEGEGETVREKGGQVSIGPSAFTSVAWLYSSLKHEMVHSQQWQDPDAAEKMESKGREKQAYSREVDQAKNTGLSDAEKAEDETRLKAYK
jgi:hypothetical protein